MDIGAVSFASHETGEPNLTSYGIFVPEIIILAMTYIYQGDRETGLEVARRIMDNLVRRQRIGWDLPNQIRADTGKRSMGTEYYQCMILWALPAALAGQDLRGPCQPGGLVDRMLRAAREG